VELLNGKDVGVFLTDEGVGLVDPGGQENGQASGDQDRDKNQGLDEAQAPAEALRKLWRRRLLALHPTAFLREEAQRYGSDMG